MVQEQGLVASTKENGWAQVIVDRKDACGNCSASHCCASFGSSSKMVVKALNRTGAGLGDLVSLNISSRMALKGAAIFYLIPIAGLVSGIIMGGSLDQRLAISETSATIGFGFAGLFLGFIIAALISRWISASNRLTPVITRIIKHGLQAPESFMAIDPVCKMVVNPADAPASFIYRDKNYYFCHSKCRESFTKDPEKYL